MIKILLGILISLSQVNGLPHFSIGDSEGIEIYAKKKKGRGGRGGGRKPRKITIKHTGVVKSLGEGAEERISAMQAQSAEIDESARMRDQAAMKAKMLVAGKADEQNYIYRLKSQYLTKEKANTKDSSGYTYLHYAAMKGWRDAARLLLEYKADPTVADNNGLSAMDWARRNNDRQMLAIFQQSLSAPK